MARALDKLTSVFLSSLHPSAGWILLEKDSFLDGLPRSSSLGSDEVSRVKPFRGGVRGFLKIYGGTNLGGIWVEAATSRYYPHHKSDDVRASLSNWVPLVKLLK